MYSGCDLLANNKTFLFSCLVGHAAKTDSLIIRLESHFRLGKVCVQLLLY